MGKKLIIRADATTAMGIGHIMRCIALAQAWQQASGEVTFLSHCENEVLRQRILWQGFGLISVDHPGSGIEDLKQTISLLQNSRRDGDNLWLVLDGYDFGPTYQESIRKAGKRLMVIDDYNHLPHYHADVLVNQNLNANQLLYSCEPYTRLLLGPRYVLLRPEFMEWRNWRRETPEVARRVLVTLGGSDPHNVTLQVINFMKVANISDLEVKFVAGPSNPHIETLKEALPRAPSNMSLIFDTENIAELMAWADVAVSAGGSTCWEMCFMRLPLVTIILADNQKNISQELERTGVGISCGWYYDLDAESMAKQFLPLIYDRDRRARMSEKAGQLVDGLGVKRTIETMETIT